MAFSMFFLSAATHDHFIKGGTRALGGMAIDISPLASLGRDDGQNDSCYRTCLSIEASVKMVLLLLLLIPRGALG